MKRIAVTQLTRTRVDPSSSQETIQVCVNLDLAETIDEAVGAAIARAEINWPSADGWVTKGKVISNFLTDEFVRAAADLLPRIAPPIA